MKWYVVITKPGNEAHLSTLLDERGIWHYYPTGDKSYWNRRKKVMVTENYVPFPSYLFVLASDHQLREVAECGGRTLKRQLVPLRVPEALITGLVEAERTGLYDLKQGVHKRLHPFAAGQQVLINILGQQISGVVQKMQGANKVVVKAKKFGKNITATLSSGNVQAA